MRKKIAILGSTGSIGTQTLDIVREQGDIDVVAMAAGSNIKLLEAQMREFHPSLVSVWDEEKAKEFLALKGVISVVVVTGRYDLIIHLATDTTGDNSLLNFFKNELSKVKGVSDVETFVVYQSHNYRIPYII